MDSIFSLLQVFLVTQSIYAVLGIIVFILLIGLILELFKKIKSLEEKVGELTKKGMRAAENTRNMGRAVEGYLLYGLLKIMEKINKNK